MEDDLKKNKKWKTTSKKIKNLRQPTFFWKTRTTTLKKNERRPKKNKKNGRRPNFFFEKLEWPPQKKWKITSKKNKKMEDDLKK